jgi:hypothetical protein
MATVIVRHSGAQVVVRCAKCHAPILTKNENSLHPRGLRLFRRNGEEWAIYGNCPRCNESYAVKDLGRFITDSA